MIWRIGVAVAAVLSSCAGPTAYLKTDSEPWLRYERTPCFGACPSFILEVHSDGQARYNGRRNVAQEGIFSSQWTEAQMQQVAQTAHEVAFKDKVGVYDNPMVTDLPTKRILLSGMVLVDRIDAPPVDALYILMDSLISVTGWSPEGL